MTATVLVHIGAEFNGQTRLEFFTTPCAQTTQALKDSVSLVRSQITGDCVFTARVLDTESVYVDGYIEVSPPLALEAAQVICLFLASQPGLHVQVASDPQQSATTEFDERFYLFDQISNQAEQTLIAQVKAHNCVTAVSDTDSYKYLH